MRHHSECRSGSSLQVGCLVYRHPCYVVIPWTVAHYWRPLNGENAWCCSTSWLLPRHHIGPPENWDHMYWDREQLRQRKPWATAPSQAISTLGPFHPSKRVEKSWPSIVIWLYVCDELSYNDIPHCLTEQLANHLGMLGKRRRVSLSWSREKRTLCCSMCQQYWWDL